MKIEKKISFILFFLVLSVLFNGVCLSQSVKLAIVPFDVKSDENIDYVKEGIYDMFFSRLNEIDYLSVSDRYVVEKAVHAEGDIYTDKIISDAGIYLSVDYILTGKIEKNDGGYHITVKITSAGNMQQVNMYKIRIDDLDMLIPEIVRCSDLIDKDLFKSNFSVDKKADITDLKTDDHLHPEKLLP